MIEKDRSVVVNKIYLSKMLPLLYQTHLENQLEDAELLFLNLLINVMQDIKEVSIERIATALPIPILFESRRKKVQRFLSLPIFNVKKLWFPIIKDWLSQHFSAEEMIYLVVDRTSCRHNLIMISVINDTRAIPIYFELLQKLGSSNLAEQTKLFSQVLQLFNKAKIVVLADREFCSVQLANWLNRARGTVLFEIKKE